MFFLLYDYRKYKKEIPQSVAALFTFNWLILKQQHWIEFFQA